MNASIRLAARREIPEIASLIASAYEEFRQHAPAVLFDAYLAMTRNVGQRFDEAEILVADLAGRIVGTVTFYADASQEGLGLPDRWSGFRTLAVHSEARGRGLGRMLVERCVERALICNAQAIGIHTAAFMTVACGIYERIGFRRSPEYDLRLSAVMGHDPARGDFAALAYRLDLAAPGK